MAGRVRQRQINRLPYRDHNVATYFHGNNHGLWGSPPTMNTPEAYKNNVGAGFTPARARGIRRSLEPVEGAKADALPQPGGSKSRPYKGIFTAKSFQSWKGDRL